MEIDPRPYQRRWTRRKDNCFAIRRYWRTHTSIWNDIKYCFTGRDPAADLPQEALVNQDEGTVNTIRRSSTAPN